MDFDLLKIISVQALLLSFSPNISFYLQCVVNIDDQYNCGRVQNLCKHPPLSLPVDLLLNDIIALKRRHIQQAPPPSGQIQTRKWDVKVVKIIIYMHTYNYIIADYYSTTSFSFYLYHFVNHRLRRPLWHRLNDQWIGSSYYTKTDLWPLLLSTSSIHMYLLHHYIIIGTAIYSIRELEDRATDGRWTNAIERGPTRPYDQRHIALRMRLYLCEYVSNRIKCHHVHTYVCHNSVYVSRLWSDTLSLPTTIHQRADQLADNYFITKLQIKLFVTPANRALLRHI